MSLQTGSVDADGLARTTDGKLYVTLGSGSTIDSPTFTGVAHGGYTRIASWGVPFVYAPTGSMGNNGALTLGTALRKTYSNGCWIWLPAGAVAAGVPAAASWLWCVMSSTTVGTVFNSTYSSGIPSPGTATAFATTGPGAFTGSLTEAQIVIPISAGALGTTGRLNAYMVCANNNSAGTKIPRIRWNGAAGTAAMANAQTTSTGYDAQAQIWNTGVTGGQVIVGIVQTSGGGIGWTGPTDDTQDTTLATDVRFSNTRNTATDYAVIEAGFVDLLTA